MESSRESALRSSLLPIVARLLAVVPAALVLSCDLSMDVSDETPGGEVETSAPEEVEPGQMAPEPGEPSPTDGPEKVGTPKGPAVRVESAGPPVTRTGARRVAVLHKKDHYVSYVGRVGPKLAKLDQAIDGKSFAFEVAPLEELEERKIDNGFRIQKAGEIVSHAIASQLETMGYAVVVDLPGTRGDVGTPDAPEAAPVDLAKALLARIGGAVEYWVEHGFTEDNAKYETRSGLRVDLGIQGKRPGGESSPIHRLEIEDEERIVGGQLAESAIRARKAATAVLERVIANILREPGLEEALVKFVRESWPGE